MQEKRSRLSNIPGTKYRELRSTKWALCSYLKSAPQANNMKGTESSTGFQVLKPPNKRAFMS